MGTTIFINEQNLNDDKVLQLFSNALKSTPCFPKSEIEELSEIYAKNLVDKFIVSDGELDETFGMGWALLRGVSSMQVRTYIEVTDTQGKSYVFIPEKHLRLDVKADKCGNSNYNMCGFLISGFSGMFQEGDLKFRAFLEYEGQFYTNGI